MKSKLHFVTACLLISMVLLSASCAATTTNSSQSSPTASSTNDFPSDKYGMGVTATIKLEESPKGLAYDPNMSEIFVLNNISSFPTEDKDVQASIISDKTNESTPTVFLPNGNELIVYDSGKNEYFATGFNEDDVFVISGSSDALVATLTLDHNEAPNGIAYDSGKSGDLYFRCSRSSVSDIRQHK